MIEETHTHDDERTGIMFTQATRRADKSDDASDLPTSRDGTVTYTADTASRRPAATRSPRDAAAPIARIDGIPSACVDEVNQHHVHTAAVAATSSGVYE